MESNNGHRRIFGREVLRREVGDFALVESLYPANSRMQRHSHELAHISVVLRGTYTEYLGPRSRACAPSALLLHPPGEDHAVAFHGAGARIFSVHLGPGWLGRVREHSKVLDSPAAFLDGPPAWLAVRLYRESRALDDVAPLMVESLALEIVAETSRQARASEGGAPRWLEEVRELLHASVCEGVTFAGLAEAAGVHPVRLAREFRRHYRCTMGDYLRRLRVRAACRALSETDAPFSEVATAAGFYDQSHLSNTLKRFTGMTPAQYRAAFRAR